MHAAQTLTILFALIGICLAANSFNEARNLHNPTQLALANQGLTGLSNVAVVPQQAGIPQQQVVAEPLVNTLNGQQGVQLVPVNNAGLQNGGLVDLNNPNAFGQAVPNQHLVFFNAGSTAKISLFFMLIVAVASL
ncbi:hypothetical protein LPJ73_005496 [Coemansia sp. RSA 2703]|nr:hypothetical protein LPJ73_005496 [Coemansia sp. RSA 2703]KAJ2377329.1 hypothetical protein IW150_001445 [Coemansia sp. RSA 2607]KAJ2396455.1 hypothetical protein GGI05_001108 [Coemansia sp. RSA 2603]